MAPTEVKGICRHAMAISGAVIIRGGSRPQYAKRVLGAACRGAWGGEMSRAAPGAGPVEIHPKVLKELGEAISDLLSISSKSHQGWVRFQRTGERQT